MKQLLLNEPAAVLSSFLAVVVALLALLQVFGVDISDEQQAALIGFVGSVGALAVGLITRSLVTPVNKDARRAL